MTADLVERITRLLWLRESATAEEIVLQTEADGETVAQTLTLFADLYEVADDGADERWRLLDGLRATLGERPKGGGINFWTLLEISNIAKRQLSRIAECRACGM